MFGQILTDSIIVRKIPFDLTYSEESECSRKTRFMQFVFENFKFKTNATFMSTYGYSCVFWIYDNVAECRNAKECKWFFKYVLRMSSCTLNIALHMYEWIPTFYSFVLFSKFLFLDFQSCHTKFDLFPF